jgi:hypothetical protein
MRPGTWLRAGASRVCSSSTMDRLIDPVLADMECEYDEADRNGRPHDRRMALVGGYVAFWKILALYVPLTWVAGIVSDWPAPDRRVLGRALRASALTTIAVSALFIAPPLLRDLTGPGALTVWMILLLLPQSFPLSLPVAILAGVLYGSWGAQLASSIRRKIMVIGLAGSLASLGTMAWLVPAANQAFRVGVAGRQLERGASEMSLGSLRERALAIRNETRPAEKFFPVDARSKAAASADLLLMYHARVALAAAVPIFALFGIGVMALRVGRARTAAIGAAACILYLNYFFGLSSVPVSVFSRESVVAGLAWLPNLLLVLTSLAFLSPDRPSEPRSNQ